MNLTKIRKEITEKSNNEMALLWIVNLAVFNIVLVSFSHHLDNLVEKLRNELPCISASHAEAVKHMVR